MLRFQTSMCCGLQEHVWTFITRTHRSQYIIVLIANVYFNDVIRTHSWIRRRKDTGGMWRNPCADFPMPSPSQDWACRTHSSPSNKNVAIHVQYFCPRKSIKDSVPKIIIRAGHIGTYLCMYLAYTKTPASQRESMCSRQCESLLSLRESIIWEQGSIHQPCFQMPAKD